MKRIAEKRMVPAATVENPDEGLLLAEAMIKGGLDIIEVTFRTAAAGAAMKAIAAKFPELLLGAGTVLTLDQLKQAIDAGAKFAVAPGLNEKLVAEAQKGGIAFVPGVATATEVDRAIGAGCRLLKFFPASNLGGVDMLKALAGPFGHTGVKFIPTGGVNGLNAREYLALPVVAAVGGSWMVNPKLVKEKKWAEITKLCHEAVEMGKAKM